MKERLCIRIDVEIEDGKFHYRIYEPDRRKKNKLARLLKWEQRGAGIGPIEFVGTSLLHHVKGIIDYTVHLYRLKENKSAALAQRRASGS